MILSSYFLYFYDGIKNISLQLKMIPTTTPMGFFDRNYILKKIRNYDPKNKSKCEKYVGGDIFNKRHFLHSFVRFFDAYA